MKNRSKVGVA